MIVLKNENEAPPAEHAPETIAEKSVRLGLGITSSIALFGCGGCLVLMVAGMLILYIYSLVTGVPLFQFLE